MFSGRLMRSRIKKQLIEEINALRTEEGYLLAGIPRFKCLFGRDSLIASWELLSYDSEIARNTLRVLAQLQGEKEDFETEEEPGKILHEIYPQNISQEWWEKWKKECKWLKKGKAYYNAEDSTVWFLVLAGKYFLKTKDKKFLEIIRPNIERALEWVFKYGNTDKDSFVEAQKRNPEVPSYPSWTEKFPGVKTPIAPVDLQGLTFKAFNLIKEIAEEKELTSKLSEESKKLKREFNERFWMPDKEFFAFALDGDKKQIAKVTSSPGHLLFTGIVDEDKREKIVKKLFSRDLWTPYGIRMWSKKEYDFDPLSYRCGAVWPHDNWITAQGLKKLGYKKEYKRIKKALLKAFKELGYLPELYGVVDNKIELGLTEPICYPQAWSSAALLNFLEE